MIGITPVARPRGSDRRRPAPRIGRVKVTGESGRCLQALGIGGCGREQQVIIIVKNAAVDQSRENDVIGKREAEIGAPSQSACLRPDLR